MNLVRYIVVDNNNKMILIKEFDYYMFININSDLYQRSDVKLFVKESTALARMEKEIIAIGVGLGIEEPISYHPNYKQLYKEFKKEVLSRVKIVKVKVSFSTLEE
jgi:hypothetical protein